MTEASTYSDDDADALERYASSSDDEAPVPQPERPKRVYKRKPVEEDKRRKGNHSRTPAQVAAFERMLEVRRQMNDDRKVAKTTKMMKRTKAIEEKVSKRRTKEEAEDELVAERLARKPARKQPARKAPRKKKPPPPESETDTESSDDDEPPPPPKPRKRTVRKQPQPAASPAMQFRFV